MRPDIAKYYFRVLTNEKEIYLYADTVEERNGALFFEREKDSRTQVLCVLAPGTWKEVAAATPLDGSLIAIEYEEPLEDE